MCIEIEAKLKVDSLKQAGRRLAELQAEFLGEQMERDYYFDDENTTLTKTDCCIRLRRQTKGGNEKLILTYKGAREKDKFKKRQEIEIEVTDGESTEKLLSVLGYKRILVFEKKRRIWRFGGCEITLDELPLLGSFVEIEGPDDDKITDVQEQLGLAELPHIGDSYATLMSEKLCQLGKKDKEAFFVKA